MFGSLNSADVSVAICSILTCKRHGRRCEFTHFRAARSRNNVKFSKGGKGWLKKGVIHPSVDVSCADSIYQAPSPSTIEETLRSTKKKEGDGVA